MYVYKISTLLFLKLQFMQKIGSCISLNANLLAGNDLSTHPSQDQLRNNIAKDFTITYKPNITQFVAYSVIPQVDPLNESVNNQIESEYRVCNKNCIYYEDQTTFDGGMNFWDFIGQWAKYDLNDMKGMVKPVPDIPHSADQVVFIAKVSSFGILRKPFPSLMNATLTISSFANHSQDLNVAGYASSEKGEKIIFNLTKEDFKEENFHWFTSTYKINSDGVPFNICIRLQSSSNAIWATDVITVKGWYPNPEAKLNIEVNEHHVTQTTSSTPLITQSKPINQEIHSNSDVPFSSKKMLSTSETGMNNSAFQGGENVESSNESMRDIAQIASAIWDAFYVFLALFCACLIALITLIVRQKCRDDSMPTTVATYSPRTSTYQLEKSRENVAYHTDSV